MRFFFFFGLEEVARFEERSAVSEVQEQSSLAPSGPSSAPLSKTCLQCSQAGLAQPAETPWGLGMAKAVSAQLGFTDINIPLFTK